MRLDPATSLLGVIDIQQRLLPALPGGPAAARRAERVVRAAGLLGVPAVLTEQYPKGLGPTPAELADVLPPAVAKLTFSAAAEVRDAVAAAAAARGAVEGIVLCGFETHVCVAQTALDLLGDGFAVFLVVDALASRRPIDHEVGLRRLEGAGAVPVTSEAVVFEWARSAEHPQFQALRRLVLDID